MILGYIVRQQGRKSFWQFVDQAPEDVQQVIRNTPQDCILYNENDITIQPVREHIRCAQWIVRIEESAGTVFYGRSSCCSPLRPEEDHEKRRRFTVIAYCFSEEEAAHAANYIVRERNFRIW